MNSWACPIGKSYDSQKSRVEKALKGPPRQSSGNGGAGHNKKIVCVLCLLCMRVCVVCVHVWVRVVSAVHVRVCEWCVLRVLCVVILVTLMGVSRAVLEISIQLSISVTVTAQPTTLN